MRVAAEINSYLSVNNAVPCIDVLLSIEAKSINAFCINAFFLLIAAEKTNDGRPLFKKFMAVYLLLIAIRSNTLMTIMYIDSTVSWI